MKTNDKKDEIVKCIQKMSGRYTPYVIFSDWVKVCAIVIQNSLQMIHDNTWKMREKQYLETMSKYNTEEKQTLIKMYAMLIEAFEIEMKDILGEIFMEAECASKNTGQFFTPFHISYLTAKTAIPNDISENNVLKISEPSTGGGGMIIAAAKVLKERDINYQRCMDITAKDLDWNGVYMTYVQLSILGIKATVIQGSSLENQLITPERIFYTPKKMGMII